MVPLCAIAESDLHTPGDLIVKFTNHESNLIVGENHRCCSTQRARARAQHLRAPKLWSRYRMDGGAWKSTSSSRLDYCGVREWL